MIIAIFFSYHSVSKILSKSEEKKVSIRLASLQKIEHKPSPVQKVTKPRVKKVIKKTHKAKKKKLSPPKTPKKVIKTKKVHKSVVKEKIEKRIVKPSQEKPEESAEKEAEVVEKEVKVEEEVVEAAESNSSSKTVPSETLYMEKNLEKIVALLKENLYYPRRARKRGVEGEVLVSFRLLKNAEVCDIKVLNSPSDILSRGAIRTLEELSSKFPKPEQELNLKVPIYYKLH